MSASAARWPASFFFVTCQPGMERAVKDEVARAHGALRFAFSRPGFVTFKAPEPLPLEAPLHTVFARAFGVSLGKVEAPAERAAAESAQDAAVADGPQETSGAGSLSCALAANTLAALESLRALGAPLPARLRLHVFEREERVPGEEPAAFTVGALAASAECALREAASAAWLDGPRAAPGEVVLDVVVLEPAVWWLGAHVHGSPHSPHPGGRPPVVVPAQAPSRAYLKLEEALAWSALPLRAGDTAVELGSAPGGASWALLQRGLQVVGVDPAAMAPGVLAHPHFRHVTETAGRVRREALPRRVDWLLLDVNLAPRITLAEVFRLGRRMSETLLGVVLTLKLNEARVAAEVPAMLAALTNEGFQGVRAAQLPSHRRELVAVALTPRGLSRLPAPEPPA